MLRTVVDFGTLMVFGVAVPLRVYGYGLMLVFGFLSGIWLARWRAKRAGENPDNMTQCSILALVGGVAGARIAFAIEKWDTFAQSESPLAEIVNITGGGLIYYGGVILALVLVVAYLRFKRLGIRRYLDILAASMMIGLAFGRVGCLVNGCCYGARCSGDWALAIKFPMYSKPLIKAGGSAGPFSASMDAPSPVYAEQLVARAVHLHKRGISDGPDLACRRPVEGHVSPDARLVHQFGASRVRIKEGNKKIEVPALLLHPPRYLHGRLKSDQLVTMLAAQDGARAEFEALAGADGRLNYQEWCKGLEDGKGFLRGSEHWDEAIFFDRNPDELLSFDEAWEYLQKRRARLTWMFPAEAPATEPAVGGKPATAHGDINRADANAYLQEDLFALAGRSYSLPVKPAQVIGIINALLLAALLTGFHRLRKREGQVFALMLILYPITRFLLEMIRDQSQHDLLGGVLTHNQWTSLATTVTGIIFWGILYKLPRSARPLGRGAVTSAAR